jgi:hypothetical protein
MLYSVSVYVGIICGLFYAGTCGTPCVGTDRVPSENRQSKEKEYGLPRNTGFIWLSIGTGGGFLPTQ